MSNTPMPPVVRRPYKIEYRDPESGELVTETMYFTDTATVTADEWAEDYAYNRADKGFHRVTRLDTPAVQMLATMRPGFCFKLPKYDLDCRVTAVRPNGVIEAHVIYGAWSFEIHQDGTMRFRDTVQPLGAVHPLT